MPLPAVLYLALMDRLGDSWEAGEWSLYVDTLELFASLPARLTMPRCAVRVTI